MRIRKLEEFDPPARGEISRNWELWWNRKLDRPLFHVAVRNAFEPRLPEPKFAFHRLASNYPDEATVQDVFDSWEHDLSGQAFMGDGFPHKALHLGPSFLAALMGARVGRDPNNDTVNISPVRILEPSEIRFRINWKSEWSERYVECCRSAFERWKGRVTLGMVTGGVMDAIAAGFRTTTNLLMDLYDYPEDIKRLIREAHEVSWQYFDSLNRVIGECGNGYSTAWPFYSKAPFQILISDFSFMISNEMFEEFVLPELKASVDKLERSFYHLDGPGQIKHIDSLLSIDGLTGIQWQPGDGARTFDHWPDLLRKIRDRGKLVQVFLHDLEQLDRIESAMGSLEGFVFFCGGFEPKHIDAVAKRIERYYE